MDSIERCKIERTVRVFPVLFAFLNDMVLYMPINTFYLTMTKGLSASEMSMMAVISSLAVILSQKILQRIVNKIGNHNSVILGTLVMIISTCVLIFGDTFPLLVLGRSLRLVASVFCSMQKVILKNNLQYADCEEQFYTVMNRAKIAYTVLTIFTTVIATLLFNRNNYLPMYISIGIYSLVLIATFFIYEQPVKVEKKEVEGNTKSVAFSSVVMLVIIANAVFFMVVDVGQANGKLFMQYDFQEHLSTEQVTQYITVVLFLSRIARLLGTMIFGKLNILIKEKISIVLSSSLVLALILLVAGHYVENSFTLKLILMACGFLLILAIRDTFGLNTENVILNLVSIEEREKALIKVSMYCNLFILFSSFVATLVLSRYEMVALMLILIVIASVGVFINIILYKKLDRRD